MAPRWLRLTPRGSSRSGQQSSSRQATGRTIAHRLNRQPRLGDIDTLPLTKHRLYIRTVVTRHFERHSGSEFGRTWLGNCGTWLGDIIVTEYGKPRFIINLYKPWLSNDYIEFFDIVTQPHRFTKQLKLVVKEQQRNIVKCITQPFDLDHNT